MAKNIIPSQFTPDQANSLRQELDNKIDKKHDKSDFNWFMGIFIGILCTIFVAVFGLSFWFNYNYLGRVNEKMDNFIAKENEKSEALAMRIAVLETKSKTKS